jgi:hypothetical protein
MRSPRKEVFTLTIEKEAGTLLRQYAAGRRDIGVPGATAVMPISA